MMEYLSASSSFNFRPVYHQDLEYYIKNFMMDLQEAIFDKKAFREELRNQKLKVAKLEEQQPRDTGDSSGTEGQYDHGSCEGC